MIPPEKRPIPCSFRLTASDYAWIQELIAKEDYPSLAEALRKTFIAGKNAISSESR